MARGPSKTVPPAGRLLGVDLGDVRMGLALSDASRIVATAYQTVDVERADDLDAIAQQIVASAAEAEAVAAIIGLPRQLDGRDGAAATRARAVAAIVAKLGLPTDLWDERFSTVEAERVMIDQGSKRKQRRQSIDRVAATIILSGYLERLRAGVQR